MAEPYCNSYYSATANDTAPFMQFQGDIDVDVAIIGGGFTGIASAVELSERGLRVAVLEANQIGWGASGRNGGQVTGSLSGDKAMVRQFTRQIGAKAAAEFVWNMRWRGHDIIKSRVEKYSINCDLKHGHLLAAYKMSHISSLRDFYEEACRKGMEGYVELIEGSDMQNYLETDLYPAGLLNKKNMHIHSLNLCLGEADAARSLGAQIFCNSKVTEIIHGKRPIVRTKMGSVTTDIVLLAGNAYHNLDEGKMRGALFPASLGVMATEPLGDIADQINPHNLAVYDTRMVLDYYRLTADKRLIFGGGTNYRGNGHDIGAVERELRPALEHTFPRLKGIKIDYQWSGQAGIIVNRIPHLGQLASNVFFAEGYSGHGVATSHIVAEIMAKAITGDSEELNLFANVRHMKFPFSRRFGHALIALGMWYYLQREKLK